MTSEGTGASGLRSRLAAAGLEASAWSNGPRYRYAAHEHDYDKVLVVEEGSITFTLADGAAVELRPGERLDLPAHTAHGAAVGPDGVVCLEAHLPAGSLGPQPRAVGGDW